MMEARNTACENLIGIFNELTGEKWCTRPGCVDMIATEKTFSTPEEAIKHAQNLTNQLNWGNIFTYGSGSTIRVVVHNVNKLFSSKRPLNQEEQEKLEQPLNDSGFRAHNGLRSDLTLLKTADFSIDGKIAAQYRYPRRGLHETPPFWRMFAHQDCLEHLALKKTPRNN